MSHQNIEEVWLELVSIHKMYKEVGKKLGQYSRDELNHQLKKKFHTSDLAIVLDILEKYPSDMVIPFFAELLSLATCYHAQAHRGQKIILSLPKEWLIENIEPHIINLLSDATYEEYWGVLSLTEKIDRSITLKIATQAAANSDEDIQDAGVTYINKLEEA